MKNTRLVVLLLLMIGVGYAAFFMPEDALDGLMADPKGNVVDASLPTKNPPARVPPGNQASSLRLV
jgi:hypothetical protein